MLASCLIARFTRPVRCSITSSASLSSCGWIAEISQIRIAVRWNASEPTCALS
jgi:hypothetical protein